MPDRPVPVVMPVRDGWEVSSTPALAAMASPRNIPMNWRTWARSFSPPPKMSALLSSTMSFGLMSSAASRSRGTTSSVARCRPCRRGQQRLLARHRASGSRAGRRRTRHSERRSSASRRCSSPSSSSQRSPSPVPTPASAQAIPAERHGGARCSARMVLPTPPSPDSKVTLLTACGRAPSIAAPAPARRATPRRW